MIRVESDLLDADQNYEDSDQSRHKFCSMSHEV